MKRILLLLISFITTTISSQNKIISGTISGFKDGDKVLLDDVEIMEFIDSTYVKNGKFVLRNKQTDVPKTIYLTIKSEKEFYSVPLFIANENVIINADKKDFPYNVKVSGSIHHDKMSILNNKTKIYNIERNEVVAFLRKPTTDSSVAYKTLRKAKVDRLHAINKATDSIKKDFIRTNLNTFAAICELFYLREDFDKNEFNKLYSSFDTKYKNSIYGERIVSYLKVGDQIKNGDLFSDFEAKDQFGKTRKFSEFIGKYILLDFTETYCRPCVQSVKEIKEVFESKGEKLTIISFYADKSELIWKNGLQRDQPGWITLNDGKGPGGETLLKYGVSGYPTFFLIDPDGKIVENFFGYENQKIKTMIQNHIK
ncbi:AhpC/TSA family protein [Flavobacterium sp. LPB0248]|uniref:TlpA disulfide reductase family protein n=1 Tax=Flavobacterium sp. LPB0248 TaxID=2614441 RepID=UPI0015A578E0|nr:TlpA disulfide reductase family protein [Flavobacterium sp. LPB0248]QLC65449.1 AhpC/TSA family protein [Flavobacterium sp. LPB0248]